MVSLITFNYTLKNGFSVKHEQLVGGFHAVTIRDKDDCYYSGATRTTANEVQKYISEIESTL